MLQVTARLLVDEMRKIKGLLPGWEVLHTGGGIIVALKDFQLYWVRKECRAAISVDGDTAIAYRAGDAWLDVAEIMGKMGCLDEDMQEVVLVSSDGKKRLYPGADLLSFSDLIEIEMAMDVLGDVDFGGSALDIVCPGCRVRDVNYPVLKDGACR